MKSGLLVTAATLMLLYWLFAGEFSATEAIAMVIPLTSAVALRILMQRATARRFKFRAPWIRLVTRTMASIGKDSLKVGLFLARSLFRRLRCPAGRLQRQPFRFGDIRARDAARRALVTLSISASPDQYVIDATPDSCLLEHSLVGGPEESDPEWPV